MQAAERAENAVFCPWWPWPLTFKLVWARDQTGLPCEFSANLFSSSWDISYTKTTDWQHQKQNLPQFTECGNYSQVWLLYMMSSLEMDWAYSYSLGPMWQLFTNLQWLQSVSRSSKVLRYYYLLTNMTAYNFGYVFKIWLSQLKLKFPVCQ